MSGQTEKAQEVMRQCMTAMSMLDDVEKLCKKLREELKEMYSEAADAADGKNEKIMAGNKAGSQTGIRCNQS